MTITYINTEQWSRRQHVHLQISLFHIYSLGKFKGSWWHQSASTTAVTIFVCWREILLLGCSKHHSVTYHTSVWCWWDRASKLWKNTQYDACAIYRQLIWKYPCRKDYIQIFMPRLEDCYTEWQPCKHIFSSRKEITVYSLLNCEYSTIGPFCAALYFAG
jgi:hypothetical protein